MRASQKADQSELQKIAATVCPTGDCCIRVYANGGAPTTRLNCGSAALYASVNAIVASGWVMTATDPSTNPNLIYTSDGCLDETTPAENLTPASSCGNSNDLCVQTSPPSTTNIYTYGTGNAVNSNDSPPGLCDCVVTAATGCGSLPEITPIGLAGTLALDFAGTPDNFGESSWTLGFFFQITSAASAVSLCAFDIMGGDPFTQSYAGLWDNTGSLVASVTIPATGADKIIPTNGGCWVCQHISPVPLTVGIKYAVGANCNDYPDVAPVTYNPIVTNVEDAYFFLGGCTSTVEYPSQSEGYTQSSAMGWFGGNLLLG